MTTTIDLTKATLLLSEQFGTRYDASRHGGRSTMASANTSCVASIDGVLAFFNTGFTHLSDYLTTNPIPTPAWQAPCARMMRFS